MKTRLAAFLSVLLIVTFVMLPAACAAGEQTVTVTIDGIESSYPSASEGWRAAYNAAKTGSTVEVKLMGDWIGSGANMGTGDGFDGGRIAVPAKGTVVLDLNGYRIDRHLRSARDKGGVFYIPSGADFTINDSRPKAETAYEGIRGGIIAGGWGNDGSGCFDVGRAFFTMNGGTVMSCSTNEDGGAILCETDGAIICLNNVRFISNSTQDSTDECYGGAIYADGEIILEMKGCVFENNFSEDDGGAMFLSGDVILRAEDILFSGNACLEKGGAVFTDSDRMLSFRNCTFNGNSAGEDGGAIYTDEDGGVRLFDCILEDNRASGSGGAWYINDWATFMVNTRIVNNSCGGKGGGVFVDSDYDTNLQGLMVIKNNTSRSSSRYADLFLETGTATQARFVNGGLEEGSQVRYGTDGSGSNRVCNEMTGYQMKFFATNEKEQIFGDVHEREEAWSVASVMTEGSVIAVVVGAVVLIAAIVVLTVRKKRGGILK